METFAPEWEEWIDLNLRLGNCRQIMFQKSLEAGYSHALLKRKIGVDYRAPTLVLDRVQTVALRTAQRLQAKNLEIFRVDGFLTAQECADIVATINASELTDSSTYNVAKPTERIVNADRTSKLFWRQQPVDCGRGEPHLQNDGHKQPARGTNSGAEVCGGPRIPLPHRLF